MLDTGTRWPELRVLSASLRDSGGASLLRSVFRPLS